MTRIVALALLAGPLGATCAVAVWTPHRIVIGADSKETLIGPEGESSPVKQCKIRQIGGYFVMTAGVTAYPVSGFDVWAILDASVRATNSVPQAAEVASKEIARQYAEVLRVGREKGGARYASQLASNAPQFSMAGFRNGRPYLARYSYDRGRGGWAWSRLVYPGGGDPPGFVSLCDPRGIESYRRTHPGWRRDDPVKTVTGMIQAAASIDRSEVGPPVAVLVLDASGAHWKSLGVCR